MTASPKLVSVTVVSDIACPWCWVGKRSIELAARALSPALSLHLHWKPYQLTPDVPEEGTDKYKAYSQKFGEERTKFFLSEQSPIIQRGAPMGLEFKYHPGSKVVNTKRCHRLLYAASVLEQQNHALFTAGLQSQVKEVLLEAYHKNGADVNNKEVLRSLLTNVLPQEQLDAVLKDDQLYSKEVDAELRGMIREEPTLNGVPHFIFPNGARVSGGESVEKFAAILKQCI